jgi:hypothetical protein
MDRTAGLRHLARRMQHYRHTLFGQQRHGYIILVIGLQHGFRQFLGQQLKLAFVVEQHEFAVLFGQLLWQLLRRFELWRQFVVVDAVGYRDLGQQCAIGQSGSEHGSQYFRHAAESDRTLISADGDSLTTPTQAGMACAGHCRCRDQISSECHSSSAA